MNPLIEGPTASAVEATFEGFVRSQSHAEICDDGATTREGEIADFFFFDRWIAAELKCLEKNFANDFQAFATRLVQERGILVYGALPFDRVFRSQPDFGQLNARAIELVSKALLPHFKKANRQLRNTRSRYGRAGSFGLLILVNVDNVPLLPDVARYAIQQLLQKRKPDGLPAFSGIDAVWYFSLVPRHMAQPARDLRLLTCEFFHRGLRSDDAHLTVGLSQLMRQWAAFTEMPLVWEP